MPHAEPAEKPAVARKPAPTQVAAVTGTCRTAAPPLPTGQGRGDATIARAHTSDALATLVAIMGNSDAPATARVSAANAVLDRAWGKPRQDFEFSSAGDAVAAIQRARLRVHRQRNVTHGEAGNTNGAKDAKATTAGG
jgi:hypothetical protein